MTTSSNGRGLLGVAALDVASWLFSKLVVPASRYENGFREQATLGQSWSGMISHDHFSKTIVCEKSRHAFGLTC
jgi:hypothetical protein